MGAESLVTDRPGPSAGAPGRVPCDQAIFSSVRTPMGQGYRIIAASNGLAPNEKKAINQRSPSHGGLCRQGPGATATAFYRLSSGRLALAYSRDAGAEHTGRGAQRIHTHITVMSADGLARFAFNPFHVLRAVEAAGGLEPQLKPPKTLSRLELEPVRSIGGERARVANEQLGARWLTYAAGCAIAGRRLVFAGEFDAEALIEGVLLGVPGPLRGDLSFSAGLRFSIGRKFSIAAVCGDMKRTRRLVRGQKLAYFEPLDGAAIPACDRDPWLLMVERHWREGTPAELADTTSQPIPDCSPEALARIGSMCNDIDAARTWDIESLLQAADARLESADTNPFEADLRRTLLQGLQSHLCERLRTAGDILKYWPALSQLLRRSARGADLALAVAAVVLERLSVIAPLQAAACAVEAVDAAPVCDAAGRLSASLRIVLHALRTWLPAAPDHDLAQARTILTEWRLKLSQFQEVKLLLDRIQDRLGQ